VLQHLTRDCQRPAEAICVLRTSVRHEYVVLMMPQTLNLVYSQLNACCLYRVSYIAEAHGALHDRAAAADSTCARLEFEEFVSCQMVPRPAALSRSVCPPSSSRKLCTPGTDGQSRLETCARVSLKADATPNHTFTCMHMCLHVCTLLGQQHLAAITMHSPACELLHNVTKCLCCCK